MFILFLRNLSLIFVFALRASALWLPFFRPPERAQEQPPSSLPSTLRELKEGIVRSDAYQSLPWVELAANFSFFPRDFPNPLPFQGPREYDAVDGVEAGLEGKEVEVPPPTKTADWWWSWNGHDKEPTKTRNNVQGGIRGHNRALFPRSTFTFTCPTSVQCNDGGCCSLGDYCAIRNGQLGCCPIGSQCDAIPIPGCSVSCFGICCDLVQGIIGETICSPTPGEGGQSSGICTGAVPTSPLFTPPASCPSGQFLCGQACCPSGAGLVCDNVTIPGTPFCNIPADICPPGMRKRDANDTCLNVTTNTAAFSARLSALSVLANGTITSASPNSTITSASNATTLMESSRTAAAIITASSESVRSSGSSVKTLSATASAATTTETSGPAAIETKSTAACPHAAHWT